MYFEIFKKGNLIIRGTKILNTLSIDTELNSAPGTNIDLPIDWLEVLDGREEIKIYLDECRVLWGIVWDISVDKQNETISLDIRHAVTEWQYRQISVNHAISNDALNIVYKGDKINKDEATGETITANSFAMMSSRFATMTAEDWIAKARAYAWETATGNKLDVYVISSYVQPNNGEYDIAYYTARGTTVWVKCEIREDLHMEERDEYDNETGEIISAVPFEVYTTMNFTAEMAKVQANPLAWSYDPNYDGEGDPPRTPIPVASVVTNFINQPGEYYLTASTANGTAISVNITVSAGEDYDYYPIDDPAVVDQLQDIYTDANFAYPGWQIEFLDNSASRMIDYVYSRQDKLEALTTTMELTDDLWWRVGLWNEKKLQIGKFGEVKPYIISTKPSGKTNIKIIGEPAIDYDFENVINVATVYSDKTDGGMSSLTLREVYMNPAYQKAGFPVVILHANANNERDYRRYVSQYPKLAPNNEIEYAVLDEASIALESGTVIEGTYAFNDLSPFQIEDEPVSDWKRIKAARTVYEAVIKKLIQARRSYDVHITTEPVPCDLMVGDKVRFIYDNSLWKLDACSSYWKKILAYDDLFYITALNYNYDEYGNLVCELTLTKWLKTQRETSNT